MALGMITDVRVEGVLEFARVAERKGGAADLEEELEPSQGDKTLAETEGQGREQGCSWEVRLWGKGLEMDIVS